jgi:LysM repeat protein
LAAAFLPKPPPPPVRKPGKTPGKHKGEPGKGEPNVAKGGKGQKGDEASFLYHRARNGDTLDALSRKYAVSVMAIKQANGLKSNDLKINKTYRIPKASR